MRRLLANTLDRFDLITQSWIGWSLPPVRLAIKGAHWRPDEPSAYCCTCGDSLGGSSGGIEACATCADGGELPRGIADGVVRLGPYVGSLRQWILDIKLRQWGEMAEELGRLLGKQLVEAELLDGQPVIVAPMPMPWQRRIYRGIDHAAAIAHAVAHEMDAPMVRLLAKSNQSPQVGLSPSQRKQSGSRGMRLRKRVARESLRGCQVVLVDDVRTTGSSLKAASRLIRRAKPARVVCAVLAVSDIVARRLRDSSQALVEPKLQERSEIDQRAERASAVERTGVAK